MSIERSDFENLTAVDLQELIDAGVPEGLRVEYKADTYGNTDREKREFLKDISAFANSQGGHLIIGIRERAGVPITFSGLEIDPDAERQRLEQIARDGLEPRISGLRTTQVPLDAGGHVIVLRIPHSWNIPHRVIAQGSNRFYVRHSAGVHEPNVGELRTLFTQSAEALEYAKRFRDSRLAEIKSGVGNNPLVNNGRFLLHIVPVASLSNSFYIDIEQARAQQDDFRPMGETGGFNPRFNYYGFINERGGDENYGYTQIFRNGCLESTRANIVRVQNDTRGISGFAAERYFFAEYHTYIMGLRNLGVPPPLIIMITLEGVMDAVYRVQRDPDYEPPLPEDIIMLPECLLEDFGEEIDHHRAIRPAFDTLWNTIGFARSQFYNDAGLWVGEQRR